MFIEHKEENKYILGYYSDEHDVLHAVKNIREKGMKIHNVISPFPIHGIDDALGFKRTRIPVMGFLVGILGGILFFSFMMWVDTVDYPINYNGKPNSLLGMPAFVPIWFEVSVLSAAFSMVFTFLYACRLKPRTKGDKYNPIFDLKLLDDKMAIILEDDQDGAKVEEFTAALKENHAEAVEVKMIGELEN
jgi:hypothetical protein